MAHFDIPMPRHNSSNYNSLYSYYTFADNIAIQPQLTVAQLHYTINYRRFSYRQHLVICFRTAAQPTLVCCVRTGPHNLIKLDIFYILTWSWIFENRVQDTSDFTTAFLVPSKTNYFEKKNESTTEVWPDMLLHWFSSSVVHNSISYSIVTSPSGIYWDVF